MSTISELDTQLEKTTTLIPTAGRRIGLLANNHDSAETRLLLTPETCGRLESAGWKIYMETDAGTPISYTDAAYAEFGVEICDRSQALKCDYVLTYAPASEADILQMRPGSVQLCMFASSLFDNSLITALTERRIATVALDEVLSHNGVQIFANIVDDVDGRASVWYAQEALSFLGGGKGVLLGGVPGLAPCEVLIIGSGRKVQQAAMSAIALGANVTLMDNDMSELQVAQSICGPRLITCAIHPRQLTSRVQNADVIMLDSCTHEFEFPNRLKGLVKKNSFFLDFHMSSPSLSTPRTVTQGLATCLFNLFTEFDLKGGFENTLLTTPGVCHGMITYNGHLINKLVGSVSSIPVIDLEILLAGTN